MPKTRLIYHTPDNILPPASFEVEAGLESKPDGLHVKICQTYNHREEIPKDEFEAEGFTENDDFNWEGKLPEVWASEFNKIQAAENWKPMRNENRIGFLFDENSGFQSPENETSCCHFAEELIQACLEFSGKELPMELVLGKLEKNNFYESARILWLFSTRSVLLEMPERKSVTWQQPIWKKSWEQVKEWVEKAAEKEDLFQLPKSKGWFWLLNGEVWLPFIPGQKGEIWEALSRNVPGLP